MPPLTPLAFLARTLLAMPSAGIGLTFADITAELQRVMHPAMHPHIKNLIQTAIVLGVLIPNPNATYDLNTMSEHIRKGRKGLPRRQKYRPLITPDGLID